ncbi:hypothetical protein C2G38_2095180, partial [Gigaspora rosea]
MTIYHSKFSFCRVSPCRFLLGYSSFSVGFSFIFGDFFISVFFVFQYVFSSDFGVFSSLSCQIFGAFFRRVLLVFAKCLAGFFRFDTFFFFF